MEITPEAIHSAAHFANFSQALKYELWKKCIENNVSKGWSIRELPVERELDEIALALFDKYVEPKPNEV